MKSSPNLVSEFIGRPIRRYCILIALLLWGLAIRETSAKEIEIYFFQRGYVAGSEAAPTVLTDQAVEGFRTLRSDVRVHVVGVPWSREGDLKLRAVLLNRGRIDVFRVTNDQLPAFIPKKGRLLSPIDEWLTPDDISDIDASALDALRHQEGIMAWPLWSTALHLIGNKTIMVERGIAAPDGRPWNWDEFIQVIKTCTYKDSEEKEVWGLTSPARPPLFEWSPLLWAHSGPLFESATINSPDSIRFTPGVASGLSKVAQLQKLGVVPRSWGTDDQPSSQAQFLSGSAAFVMSSPAFIRKLAADKFPYVILPPPTGDYGKPITNGALGAFAVVDHPENPARLDAAHQFAKYLTSAEVAASAPGWYLAPPVRKSVTTFESNPDYAGLMPIVRTAVYTNSPGGAGFLEATIIPELQAAMMGKISPEATLLKIQDEYNRNQRY